MEPLRCVGGCVSLFLLAVALDALGLVLLFIGIFANLRVDGRFYGDFFIYTGALVVFLSLFCWLMWYVGNVPPPRDDEPPARSGSIALLARKLSERLGRKLRGEDGPPRAASRVTWGKSAAFRNEGYDDSPDPPAEREEKEQV